MFLYFYVPIRFRIDIQLKLYNFSFYFSKIRRKIGLKKVAGEKVITESRKVLKSNAYQVTIRF